MDLKDNLVSWKALLITAQTGNVTKTAQLLNLDPTRVSRLLTGLEQELGYQLLDRQQRPFKPTLRCLQLLSILDPVLNNFKGIDEIKNFDSGYTSIRVAAPIGLSVEYYADEYSRYLSKHQNIEFDVVPEVQLEDVIEGRVDVAVLNRLPEDLSELRVRLIGSTLAIPVATPEYLRFHGVPMTPEDLKDHRGLLMKTDNYHVTRTLQRDGETSAVLKWRSHFYAHDQLMLKHLVMRHQGITVDVYAGHVTEEMRQGKLVPLLNGWQRPCRIMCILTRQDVELSKPEVGHFARWWADLEMRKTSARAQRATEACMTSLAKNVNLFLKK